jgi:RHS repeat-associated protein
LTYNTDGTLASVQTGGQTITYQYDAAGRRVTRAVNGARTHAWLYGNGLLPLAEYDGAGALRTVYVYAAGATPAKMARGGNSFHIVSDHLGSPRLIVDAAGSVVKRIDYDSFGSVILDSNPAFDLPFGFAGGMSDPAHPLIRFGARDYLPAAGRWTAKDPILFGGEDTNLYNYARHDPVNLVDPTGLEAGGNKEDCPDVGALIKNAISTVFTPVALSGAAGIGGDMTKAGQDALKQKDAATQKAAGSFQLEFPTLRPELVDAAVQSLGGSAANNRYGSNPNYFAVLIKSVIDNVVVPNPVQKVPGLSEPSGDFIKNTTTKLGNMLDRVSPAVDEFFRPKTLAECRQTRAWSCFGQK